MNLKLTKSSTLIVSALLVLLILGTYFTFILVKKNSVPLPNVFVCNSQSVPFRANISSCLSFDVSPDKTALVDTLVNPIASRIAILVDPNSTASIGLSAHDIYKVYQSLKPKTGIAAGIAYTYKWEAQPGIPNITIDSATFQSPVIWLRLNQTGNSIVVDGPKIYVNANTADDLDAAACLISIEAIKRVMKC